MMLNLKGQRGILKKKRNFEGKEDFERFKRNLKGSRGI